MLYACIECMSFESMGKFRRDVQKSCNRIRPRVQWRRLKPNDLLFYSLLKIVLLPLSFVCNFSGFVCSGKLTSMVARTHTRTIIIWRYSVFTESHHIIILCNTECGFSLCPCSCPTIIRARLSLAHFLFVIIVIGSVCEQVASG